MLIAPVNRIIPFSNVDGPGNRMAIFFQSCPFSCWYCHNPETINLCIHCGLCVTPCPSGALQMIEDKVMWDSEICIHCDECIRVCPHSATPKIIQFSTDQLMVKIMEAKPFIRGITVSGGECMMFPEFLEELFIKVQKQSLTSLIDSNGFVRFNDYPNLLNACDGVMLDVKATDETFHKQLTGQSNQVVMQNLKELLLLKKLAEVRIVLLPRYDDQNRKTITDVVNIVQDQARIKLIKYRPYGVRNLGLEKLGSFSLAEDLFSQYSQLASSLGAKEVVVV